MAIETLYRALEIKYAEEVAKATLGAVENPNSLNTLNTQPLSAVIPIGQVELMERLRNGQVYLTELQAKSETEKLAAGFDLWGKLEKLLRFTYDYAGCIHGEDARCPEHVVCFCDNCVIYHQRKG